MKSSFRAFNEAALKPLKIAFFGSDRFSVIALDRLTKYSKTNPRKISSVDVITRKSKRTGRGLKKYNDLPIESYCEQNSINLARADSGDDIVSLLSGNQFDLSIAVSYGSLIPAKFLQSCNYGGLNLHPSLLPRYSGSSPIQYALMNDDRVTGVTVQTLHPSKFDAGEIILQSDEVRIKEEDNYRSLVERLGKLGSDLLVKVIDGDLFIKHQPIERHHSYSLASKIKSARKIIDWNSTSKQIKRLNDALGPLTTYTRVHIRKKKKDIDSLYVTILDDIKIVGGERSWNIKAPGLFELDEMNNLLVLKTKDGYISAGKLKFQYCKEEDPKQFLAHLRKRSGSDKQIFESKIKI
ncbi:uncharacterized protein PRCAT00002363001 [Priceomyces carsonii]|uniref:uncharacterized protein n=1 Tax=Priceomyces carsonii TaxID=28549 RepID=UPI002EDA9361|nr:unnamed protein product [Priceomyces carsonii]